MKIYATILAQMFALAALIATAWGAVIVAAAMRGAP